MYTHVYVHIFIHIYIHIYRDLDVPVLHRKPHRCRPLAPSLHPSQLREVLQVEFKARGLPEVDDPQLGAQEATQGMPSVLAFQPECRIPPYLYVVFWAPEVGVLGTE